MQKRTLAQIVENFYARGDETAYLIRRGYRIQRWSYRRIAQTSRQFARELMARRIGLGDKVFLWANDSPEWAVCFFGCVLTGTVVVPMDRTASPEFSRRICQQTEAKLCICSRERMQMDPAVPTLVLETLPEYLAHHSSAPLPIHDLRPADDVEIVFTSGTTADPKGVVITHQNILANLEPLEREIVKYMKYERLFHPLRFLSLLPLSHVFGQFLGLFIPQILGSAVFFQDSLNPTEIIRTIRRERISVLVAVPRILDSLREKLERDLESRSKLEGFIREFDKAAKEHYLRRWWRFRNFHSQFGWKFWAFISGGASLDAGTEQFWSRLGFAVIQGYGLTETTSLISLNHPMKLGRGSIGRVLPGREFMLASDGEILVRGDNVAQRYVQGWESKPVADDMDGWFHTGDIGALDNHGNLYFKGRRKNVLVTSEGMNIYPEDLESALRRQPEIRDCVVLGLEKSGNAEACAVLVLRHGRFSAAEAVQRANQSLAEHQQIRRWVTWPDEDFPRTSTQKPQMPAIRDFVHAQFSDIPQPDSEPGMLAGLIRRIAGRPLGSIAKKADLVKDLNLSSIERVELLSILEDRFQMDVDESTFTAARTVGDLEQLISDPLPSREIPHYPRWAQRAPVTWLRLLSYYLLVWPATHLLAYPRIEGRKNLEHLRGPLLFVSNHVTQVDIGFILAALPLRFRHRIAVAMNGEMLQQMRYPSAQMGIFRRCIERLSYWLVVSLFNVFPLPQKSGFRESFSFAGESIDRGWSVLVFPEGRRTRDGGIDTFRAGIGILGSNLGIPVIPIRIDGLFELKKRKWRFAAPGHVRVRIGAAVRYESETDASRIALDLESRVKAL
jgi:long-chain acyl-CoA synthetase